MQILQPKLVISTWYIALGIQRIPVGSIRHTTQTRINLENSNNLKHNKEVRSPSETDNYKLKAIHQSDQAVSYVKQSLLGVVLIRCYLSPKYNIFVGCLVPTQIHYMIN